DPSAGPCGPAPPVAPLCLSASVCRNHAPRLRVSAASQRRVLRGPRGASPNTSQFKSHIASIASVMTILAASATAVAVLLGGIRPWAGLGTWNLRVGTAVPWALVPMAIYLFAYWQFIGGHWGSSSSSASRRANLRANRLPPGVWSASLAAGLLGFGALLAFLGLMARLVS